MAERKDHLSVMFVCTGNICRSPTAEVVFRRSVAEAGLSHQFSISSAGTHSHEGEPPDRRTQKAARARGYDMSTQRGRQLTMLDYEEQDVLVALDDSHRAHMLRHCPPQYRAKVKLVMDYVPHSGSSDVPDPYYEGADAFEHVLDLIEEAAPAMLARLQACLSPGAPLSQASVIGVESGMAVG